MDRVNHVHVLLIILISARRPKLGPVYMRYTEIVGDTAAS